MRSRNRNLAVRHPGLTVGTAAMLIVFIVGAIMFWPDFVRYERMRHM